MARDFQVRGVEALGDHEDLGEALVLTYASAYGRHKCPGRLASNFFTGIDRQKTLARLEQRLHVPQGTIAGSAPAKEMMNWMDKQGGRPALALQPGLCCPGCLRLSTGIVFTHAIGHWL